MKLSDRLFDFFSKNLKARRTAHNSRFDHVSDIHPANRTNTCSLIFFLNRWIMHNESVEKVGQGQAVVTAEDPFEVSGTASTEISFRAPAGLARAVHLKLRRSSTWVAKQLHEASNVASSRFQVTGGDPSAYYL
jgi:hypothetical protein